MKEATIETFSQELNALLDAAQQERILITKRGKPFAIVVGIANKDAEDLRLETSADFWEMIEQRRREPAVSLEKVEAELFDEGDKGKAS